MSAPIYDFTVETLKGQTTTLAPWAGKVLLIVNTASKCGLTPQYEGLEALHRKYADKGLAILGFPCNQFGAQEPGSADEIESFCSVNYGVSFPMFAKIDVNGDTAHPLYKFLKDAAPGILDTKAIKWNFTKFIVGRDGTVIDRVAPTTAPAEIEARLVELLG
ncbi:glutathione peroxidase [Viridibacterium curvum]|uniref:Glutathione peroxidase n=1 Tax=Viridibacterium curvum TaxID=1101404 RepID=A0ABP9QFK2_9RHOO